MFVYLFHTMEFTHDKLMEYPKILRKRPFVISNRHRFLLYLGKAQFDVNKENYISLQKFCEGTEQDFCEHVAKVPIEKFFEFQKCL